MSAAVTTVIVNYNAGEWLARAVRSALDQTPGPVVIVDNGSTDSSLAELTVRFGADPRLQVIENQGNRGYARAANQALAELASDYAILMNPDCEMQAGCWPALHAVMQADPTIGLAGCVVRAPDGALQATCRRRFPTPASAAARMLGLRRWFPDKPEYQDFDYGDQPLPETVDYPDAVSGAFMAVRRDALASVGLLDEGYFMHCEDLDWCMRFRRAGYRIAFVPDAEVVHAKGVSSEHRPLRVQWYLHRGMQRFFAKHYRNQYAAPTRWLVSAGIYASFALRAVKLLVR